MLRTRSPGYPNYSLRQAISNAGKIFDQDRRNPIDREVVAKHMGYSGLSGAADKALATLMHYGLLTRLGKGEVQVSQTAVDILHPDSATQKRQALLRAAFAPKLFKTLKERFPDDKFSDDALRSFLMRENFLERAINPVLKAYADTCALLKQENAYEGGMPDIKTDGESFDEDDDDRVVVYGGAVVGDIIQWESEGVLKLEKPSRVRALRTHEGKEWVFVDGSPTGIPMDEVVVEQKAQQERANAPILPIDDAHAAVKAGWHEERLIDDGGDEIFIRYEGEPSVQRYEFIRDYLDFKLNRLKPKA